MVVGKDHEEGDQKTPLEKEVETYRRWSKKRETSQDPNPRFVVREPQPGDFFHKLEFPESLAHQLLSEDPGFFNRANRYSFWYAVLGLAVGVICVSGGLALFLHGITGATSWTTKVLGAESQISDAAPGAVFGILGFFVIYITRYKVTVKRR